jgi:hypothetical protein
MSFPPETSLDSGARAEVLFAGDAGQLPLDTRRVLTQLLQGPSVDGQRHTKLWPVLLRDEFALRSRLHEMFLDLVVDRDMQVAFTRKVQADGLEFPILLRRNTLTYVETVLLLFLRKRLTESATQGERSVVSDSEMLEHLRTFEKDGNANHALFEKQIQGAIDKGKNLSLLHKIRGSEDRYEISPTLKLLFNAEEIQLLTAAYAKAAIADEEPASGEGSDVNQEAQ